MTAAVRLRHLARINPPTPAFDELGEDEELTFLPMEAVWPGSRLDLSRRRTKKEVATGYTRFQDGDVLVPKITPTFEAGRAVLIQGLAGGVGAGTTELHVVRPGKDIDPGFLLYVVNTHSFLKLGEAEMYGVAGQQRVPDGFLRDLPVRLPPLAEQRRIAGFLDAETSRLDRISRARDAQSRLLDRLLGQLVDGAMAGEGEALKRLGVSADVSDWDKGKVSRLCEVIPGYAFPSDAFVQDGTTRLLRGVNVSVDRTSWTDCAWWDEEKAPTPIRFHLRVGDLVLGMDRPWISTGMRIAFITDSDLPALLLQRVACLRPKSAGIDMRYVYWSLRSSHFRRAVEGELTGVSVPHLSGDQIGTFAFPLPPAALQRTISDQLAVHSSHMRQVQSAMTRQAGLLNEQRQALITAAVTGRFDVSTAGGRTLTEG
jgi:type I restriction enzyme S subunit